MPHNYLEQVRQPGQTVNPLFAFLGVSILEIEPDRAVLRLPVRPELIQGGGVVAGGILASLLDETMAHAVLAGNPTGQITATIDMSVTYLRSVGRKAVLDCEARVVKRGSRVVFAEAVILDNEKEAARATASFIVTTR